MAFPRVLIAALRGGSGKTIVSLGLIASWKKRGVVITPFKKGPDFIDAGWLALAANQPCRNLDTFFMPAAKILSSFTQHALSADLSVIEGNRGLYDGIDVEGSTSTAELAKLLHTPVVLVIDCTKSTRTVAAMVLGCLQFDQDVNIAGVILNRVAGARHESILRQSVESYCHVPVLGAIPKLKGEAFPERHMGLVPTPEHAWAQDSVDMAATTAKKYLDLEGLLAIARQEKSLEATDETPLHPMKNGVAKEITVPLSSSDQPRIGVIRDGAFQFYYPENLEALEAAGAEVVIMSALADNRLPKLDGLYIGGGFPETHAQILADNKGFRDDLRYVAEQGLPIYAECGGLMYLGESLVLDDGTYPMAGVLPLVFQFSKKPQGHGYSVLQVTRHNPFFEAGTEIRGHEFHYSSVLEWRGKPEDLAFKMVRGGGLDGNGDGICYKNTLATYTHIHALGTPSWAPAMVKASRDWQKKERK